MSLETSHDVFMNTPSCILLVGKYIKIKNIYASNTLVHYLLLYCVQKLLNVVGCLVNLRIDRSIGVLIMLQQCWRVLKCKIFKKFLPTDSARSLFIGINRRKTIFSRALQFSNRTRALFLLLYRVQCVQCVHHIYVRSYTFITNLPTFVLLSLHFRHRCPRTTCFRPSACTHDDNIIIFGARAAIVLWVCL